MDSVDFTTLNWTGEWGGGGKKGKGGGRGEGERLIHFWGLVFGF